MAVAQLEKRQDPKLEYPAHLASIHIPPVDEERFKTDEDYQGRIVQFEKDIDYLKEFMLDYTQAWMKKKGCARLVINEITGVTGSCEQRRNVFRVMEGVEKGDRRSNLRQTAQLEMERIIVRRGYDRVWTTGRSYRQEDNADGRHQSEFELIEYEIRNRGLPKLVEYNIDYFILLFELLLQDQRLLNPARRRRLDYWFQMFKKRVADGKAAITYSDAISHLQSRGFSISWGDDLKREHEHALTMFCGPVIVTHYPEKIKFFNMRRSREEEHRGCVDAMDVLLPYSGESVGGSAREENLNILLERLEQSDMLKQMRDEYEARGWDPSKVLEDFEEEYLHVFRGREEIPRCGDGKGMARILQFVLASNSIVPF